MKALAGVFRLANDWKSGLGMLFKTDNMSLRGFAIVSAAAIRIEV